MRERRNTWRRKVGKVDDACGKRIGQGRWARWARKMVKVDKEDGQDGHGGRWARWTNKAGDDTRN
eukprot:13622570-Alexandrium_andersonii.AAC.1